MTEDQLKQLQRLPLFPQTATELIQVIGLAASAKIINAWPGQKFPVPARVNGANPDGARRWDQLVEIIGEPSAALIVRHWGGMKLYIPSCKEALWSLQQDEIRAAYDDLTCNRDYSHPEAIFELGVKYRVSGRNIEIVVNKPSNDPVCSTQASLF